MSRARSVNDLNMNQFLKDDTGHNREYMTVDECLATTQFKILMLIFPLSLVLVQYYNSI